MALDRREFLFAAGTAVAKAQAAPSIVLRNPHTGFEWTARNATLQPVFAVESVYKAPAGLAVRQRYQAIPDMPVIEFRCEFQNTASAPIPAVTAFGPLRIPLKPGLGPLQVHCVRRNSYAVERLPVEDVFEITGGKWNGPDHCGLLALEAIDAREFLIAGIEWERGWRYSLSRKEDALWLQVEVTDLRHDLAPQETLSAPPVFLAFAQGDADEAFGVAQQYLKAHVFPKPLANSPWVVYDIWGTEVEGVEQALLDEMDVAAKLGVELYYVDASWYKGSSKKGDGDWGCGLGNYAEDREKFPRGLAYFSSAVHKRGMKFGLWVGPNIVDSRLLPDPIPRQWVAQQDGVDRVLTIKSWESTCHQVCLGCPEYIEHLKRNLTRIVEEFSLDWLKWDNSGIPGIPGQCNRADHGHQAGDGSYAALVGQYEIFRHLHDRFPDLVLEQCGYGSRLDYGLARTIRANWLSDSSFPSSHVRDNALVAGLIYPSFYNGGWIVKDPELEKTKDPDILDTIYRSRMIGLFGFGTLHGTLPERVSLYPAEVLEAARRNIPLYKRYRHLLHGRAYRLFPPLGSPEQWQAVQFAKDDNTEAVVLCFRGKSTQSTIRLPLRGLRPAAMYKVTDANGGAARSIAGRQLMRDGLIASLPKPEMSNVFFLVT